MSQSHQVRRLIIFCASADRLLRLGNPGAGFPERRADAKKKVLEKKWSREEGGEDS